MSAMVPAEIFTGHMVLQRQMPVRVWGFGSGEGTVSLNGRRARVTPCEPDVLREAEWEAILPAMEAGGPYELRMELDGETFVFTDVMLGEVFLAGGQSNMQYSLGSGVEGRFRTETRDALRLYRVNPYNSEGKEQVVEGGWQPCTRESSLPFSAIGVAFGLDLQKALDVPVGIIQCCVGASRTDAWTESGYIAGTSLDLPYEKKQRDIRIPFNETGFLWEHMARRAAGFAMRGVIWYQGESNRGDAEVDLYGDLFRKTVECWRDAWRQELPFITVQLAAFFTGADDDDNWSHIREQQVRCTREIPGVSMITIGDLGEPLCIHPLRKRGVGKRLALAAEALCFGFNVEYCGPVYRELRREGDTLVLYFDHGEGLWADDGITDLWVRGESGDYVPAEGRIEGDSLRVWAEGIDIPAAVHMGWRNCPEISLYNGAGLPASPFRTELNEDYPVHSESAAAP